MQIRDNFRFGGVGFTMGFYGTSVSRELRLRVESDPFNASPLMAATLVGAIDTIINRRGEASKLLPYIFGLVIGRAVGVIVFDILSQDYTPPSRRP